MIDILMSSVGTAALEGGKKAAASFGGKVATGLAGYFASNAINNAMDKKCLEKEKAPMKHRRGIVNCIGSGAGAAAYSMIDEHFISN